MLYYSKFNPLYLSSILRALSKKRDETVAMVAAAASAVLGLGLAGRRRKEDEEA